MENDDKKYEFEVNGLRQKAFASFSKGLRFSIGYTLFGKLQGMF